jgi:hypothetical protein
LGEVYSALRHKEKEATVVVMVMTIAAERITGYIMVAGMIVAGITEALITAVVLHRLRWYM